MTVTRLDDRTITDHGVVLPMTGTPDLVQLPQEARGFLTGLNKYLVADAVLLAVMLGGDAFRYGRPPVSVRLQRLADARCLRIEVEDRRPWSPNARPFGYRARLLDRLAHRRGLEPSERGGTRTWAEINLIGQETAHVPVRRAPELRLDLTWLKT
jgi:hypothetical protein